MGILYFISTDGSTKVGMDIEESISISSPSKVSKSSNMSGKTVSDGVVEGNITISASGVVTYAKLKSQEDNLTPVSFQKAIQSARRAQQRFTLYAKDDGLPLMYNYKDCVVANVNVGLGQYIDSVTVSISFEQVFISKAATASYLAPIPSADVKADVTSTTNSGDGSTTDVGGGSSAAYKALMAWIAKDEEK